MVSIQHNCRHFPSQLACINAASQDKIQAGYLMHKVMTVQREDGTPRR
jgi:hypothetical protein